MNAASYGFYLVLVKPLMATYSPLQVIKWVFTFGLIIVLPFGLSQFDEINWNFTPDVIWKIFFIIFFMTFLTYLLTIYGLGKVSPTIVSAYIYIQPVLATAIAIANNEEQLSVTTVLYGLLIMLGVFLISLPKKEAPLN